MSSNVYRAAPVFDADYFSLINMLVQEEPPNDYDKNILGMAGYIGIEKGKPYEPDAHRLEIFERAARDAQEYLIKVSDGISWVPTEDQPGWTRINLFPEDIVQGKRYVYEDEKR